VQQKFILLNTNKKKTDELSSVNDESKKKSPDENPSSDFFSEYCRFRNFDIRYSLFNIRYSFSSHRHHRHRRRCCDGGEKAAHIHRRRRHLHC
jgi:hypothetical protein